MRSKGLRFVPICGRQAFKIDGKFKFRGGLTVEAWGGGEGVTSSCSDPGHRIREACINRVN